MAHTDPPQTPQTPTPPVGRGPGTTSVTIERSVTTHGDGTDIPAPDQPRPPRPPEQADPVVGITSPALDAATLAQMIRPETVFQIQLGIEATEIDGETIVHDHLRNTNIRLNVSGSFIWSNLQPTISFADLLSSIRRNHDVVPPAVDSMVADFLGDLVARGTVAAAPLASAQDAP